jgi:glycosyltransferase involved in cell wall biosynthesis
MSTGCIPVVLDRGGVRDIITHNDNGFLAKDVDEVARYTLAVFQSPDDNIKKLRAEAIRSVVRFSHAAFTAKFSKLFFRGKMAKPFKHLIESTSGESTLPNL